VEANVHYPSDVLAGAALGSFFARFTQELFFPESGKVVSVMVMPTRETVALQVGYQF
jgi:membrane-associated phospholipid phosphatase